MFCAPIFSIPPLITPITPITPILPLCGGGSTCDEGSESIINTNAELGYNRIDYRFTTSIILYNKH